MLKPVEDGRRHDGLEPKHGGASLDHATHQSISKGALEGGHLLFGQRLREEHLVQIGIRPEELPGCRVGLR